MKADIEKKSSFPTFPTNRKQEQMTVMTILEFTPWLEKIR